jgi:C-terminal processing protease CtpA/Prc
MQKVLIGVLTLVALFFAADRARLGERLRVLESRSPAPPRPKGAIATPARVEPAPVPPLTAEPVAAAPAAASSTTVLDRAQTYVTRAIEDVEGVLGNVRTGFLVLNRKPVGEDLLGLSDSQKRAIDDLKRTRDLQTKIYKDQIQAIEGQTDLAIRQLLTAEQLAIYRGETTGELRTNDFAFQSFDAPSPDVPKSGYLGVSATSAPGGGAKIEQVMPDSAASTFGLQAGDVILDFNGENVSDFAGLTTKIRSTVEGAAVVIKINRGGTEFYQNVVLGGRK